MKLIRLRNKRPVIAIPVPIPALAPFERDEDLLIVEVEYGMVVIGPPMTEVASGVVIVEVEYGMVVIGPPMTGVVGAVLRAEAVWTLDNQLQL
jgi:hypothetical protein